MDVTDQVISIFAGSNGFLDSIPVDKVLEFERQMLQDIHTNHSDIFDTLKKEGKISDETKAALKKAIGQFKEGFVQ
jgi:F0F1-type ATP synthase alpha subunit